MRRFDFRNVNLVPRKCIVQSRSECDTSFTLGKFTFQMPIVPANMECVINDELAISLAKNNYFYIHHRFNTDFIQFSKRMKSMNLPISISIGVNDDAYTLLNELILEDLIPDYVTIDIAHGHSVKMEKMLKWIRNTFNEQIRPYVIAGNVSTGEATRDLEAWGADAIKVGIGPGSACTTYTATGFGSRGIQASVIHECASAKRNRNTVIIADGGISEPGEIAKALSVGANCVMLGGLLSGFNDSPGEQVEYQGKLYKEFWGSASASQCGKTTRIEGKKTMIPLKNRGILQGMNYLKECLQSAISYGGGKDLNCFTEVQFVLGC